MTSQEQQVQQRRQFIQWGTIIGSLLVIVGGFFLNNFVLAPLKENMDKSKEIREQWGTYKAKVDSLEAWQKRLEAWRIQILASPDISGSTRSAFSRMPMLDRTAQPTTRPGRPHQ